MNNLKLVKSENQNIEFYVSNDRKIRGISITGVANAAGIERKRLSDCFKWLGAEIKAMTSGSGINEVSVHSGISRVLAKALIESGCAEPFLQITDRTPETLLILGASIGGGFSGSALPTHNHTVALGGSGAAYTPAAIGINQFLFLGL